MRDALEPAGSADCLRRRQLERGERARDAGHDRSRPRGPHHRCLGARGRRRRCSRKWPNSIAMRPTTIARSSNLRRFLQRIAIVQIVPDAAAAGRGIRCRRARAPRAGDLAEDVQLYYQIASAGAAIWRGAGPAARLRDDAAAHAGVSSRRSRGRDSSGPGRASAAGRAHGHGPGRPPAAPRPAAVPASSDAAPASGRRSCRRASIAPRGRASWKARTSAACCGSSRSIASRPRSSGMC